MSYFFLGTLFSIICGAIIGLERELTGHKASIKVDILICLGSFAFCMTETFVDGADIRISANIVTGVGFLCSGFIFKDGLTVNGLSTAATLWSSAGLGILISKGHAKEAIILSIILFVLNMTLSKVSDKIKPLKTFDDSKKDLTYKYNIVCMVDAVEDIKKEIINGVLKYDDDLTLTSFSVNSITEDKKRVIISIKSFNFDIARIDSILSNVSTIKGVLSTSWEQKD